MFYVLRPDLLNILPVSSEPQEVPSKSVDVFSIIANTNTSPGGYFNPKPESTESLMEHYSESLRYMKS